MGQRRRVDVGRRGRGCGRTSRLLTLVVLVSLHREQSENGRAAASEATESPAPSAAEQHAEQTARHCATGERIGASRCVELVLELPANVAGAAAHTGAKHLL